MENSAGLPVSEHSGARLLMRELARIAGVLTEVATAWRRAALDSGALPLGLPLRLGEATQRLSATAAALACAEPGESLGLAVSASGQLAVLRNGIAGARDLARGDGRPATGDDLLWEDIGATMDRAVRQCLSLIIERSMVADWEVSEMAGRDGADVDGAMLCIRLGDG